MGSHFSAGISGSILCSLTNEGQLIIIGGLHFEKMKTWGVGSFQLAYFCAVSLI